MITWFLVHLEEQIWEGNLDNLKNISNEDEFSLLDINVYDRSPIIGKIIWPWTKFRKIIATKLEFQK